jgi:hypothetical protein
VPSPQASRPEQPPPQPPPEPVEHADDLNSKLTLGIYFTADNPAYDVNLRHQFGNLTAWAAGFYDRTNGTILRVGAQEDYRVAWAHFQATLEVSTTGAVEGQGYAELGGDTYAIAGVSRTNLKTFFDLSWDPIEAVQLGIGRKISSYDRFQAYTIFDVRLNTGQQDTHVIWRHKLDANNGLTIDGVYKSGRGDTGEFIRAVGIGVYYDRPTWFWKVYYDPHVNFTSRTMVRTGVGVKF